MIATTCPECDGKLVLKDEMAGRTFTCPDCTTAFRVPDAGDDEPPPRRPSRLLRFFARHWELFGCVAVCLLLVGVSLLWDDPVFASLLPALVLGTVGYAAFYRRLVHPFVGLVTVLLLVVGGAKLMERKAGHALGVGGNGGVQAGDVLPLLQGAAKNLRELDKTIQDITDGK